jgi:hypothetical protein
MKMEKCELCERSKATRFIVIEAGDGDELDRAGFCYDCLKYLLLGDMGAYLAIPEEGVR